MASGKCTRQADPQPSGEEHSRWRTTEFLSLARFAAGSVKMQHGKWDDLPRAVFGTSRRVNAGSLLLLVVEIDTIAALEVGCGNGGSLGTDYKRQRSGHPFVAFLARVA
jgi:hypothetical protein